MSPSKSAKSAFKVALVGCGRISKNHFDAIRNVEGLTLSAVSDVEPDRASEAGAEQGVQSFTNYAEMLKDADCDIVTIATPSGMHSSQGILAARAGKHVITEKPMAITLEQADALVDACDAEGVKRSSSSRTV